MPNSLQRLRVQHLELSGVRALRSVSCVQHTHVQLELEVCLFTACVSVISEVTVNVLSVMLAN
jgi:hypothetical protein